MHVKCSEYYSFILDRMITRLYIRYVIDAVKCHCDCGDDDDDDDGACGTDYCNY